MDSHFQTMLDHLRHEWVPFRVIKQLYDIDLDDSLLQRFQAWWKRIQQREDVVRNNDEISRHAFELFLQRAEVLPVKTAAARLGMAQESFVQVTDRLQTDFLLPSNAISKHLIGESEIRSLHELFPSLQRRVFSSHTDYCQRLHEAIQNDLQISVKPKFCETSRFLEDDLVNFAYCNDCITDRPVGLRYQVWLDFKKPINLRPDVCSLKFYAENEEELKSFAFAGRVPEIPDALKKVK